ncbi:TetR family transcriptional regulator [Longispora albida]|uniref:TetR/AcrR family transcriptional regulator n=1 Tax=Longispora albida TaxID=203523 RepID=UPI00036D5E21|nr:TetR family transcriptional regulator [Longispora albida]
MGIRKGRRPGSPDTRAAILAAARDAFAERGFDRASIRQIAASAGVDPALVHHYFGTKDELFLAAVQAPADPRELLPQVLAGDREQLGERLVRMFLGVWDSPAGPAAAGILRAAVSHEWSARLIREFLVSQVLRRVAAELDVPDSDRRVALVASQLMGLAMARYIIKLEPLASAEPAWIVAAVGPALQRYFTGELPDLPTMG